jgi:TetR/AcrR family transcriptional regulator
VSARSSRRRVGRPPLGEEREAREALLDAAVALFAERGVAATASAHVAERAGVTPAMVHYYFRSRDRLIDAVVSERLARFPAHVFRAPLPDVPASARVTAIVYRLFEAARQMPWMPSIWIREIVSDGGMLRERMLKHLPVEAVTRLAEAIAREQRAGRVPAGIEPRLAFISIAGATLLPLAVRSFWHRLPGMANLSDKQLERHAVTVLTAGLAPSRMECKR